MKSETIPRERRLICCAFILCAGVIGCGTTQTRTATEQLLASNAVDLSIAQIDFGVLSGRKVFLDPQYIVEVKDGGFVNSQYIISSLRQQITSANCQIQDNREDADYVIEPRVGALGTDGHEINYGFPANNALGVASSILTRTNAMAEVPEVSFAKKHASRGVAKLGVFVYDQRTRGPVWQSGVTLGESTSKSYWVMGAGPFQRGTIHEGTKFAGAPIEIPPLPSLDLETKPDATKSTYFTEHEFPSVETAPVLVDKSTEDTTAVAENAPAASAEQPPGRPDIAVADNAPATSAEQPPVQPAPEVAASGPPKPTEPLPEQQVNYEEVVEPDVTLPPDK